MRKLHKHLLLLALLFAFACKKDKKVIPNDNALTGCPVNTTCSYQYTEQADLQSPPVALKPGDYRLFWFYQQSQIPVTTILYIKAPMAGSSFILNKADIGAGKVVFVQNCPSCNLIGMEPVDGYVKGTKLDADKPADQTPWLIDGQIILQGVGQPSFRDTLTFKQRFVPNFVID